MFVSVDCATLFYSMERPPLPFSRSSGAEEPASAAKNKSRRKGILPRIGLALGLAIGADQAWKAKVAHDDAEEGAKIREMFVTPERSSTRDALDESADMSREGGLDASSVVESGESYYDRIAPTAGSVGIDVLYGDNSGRRIEESLWFERTREEFDRELHRRLAEAFGVTEDQVTMGMIDAAHDAIDRRSIEFARGGDYSTATKMARLIGNGYKVFDEALSYGRPEDSLAVYRMMGDVDTAARLLDLYSSNPADPRSNRLGEMLPHMTTEEKGAMLDALLRDRESTRRFYEREAAGHSAFWPPEAAREEAARRDAELERRAELIQRYFSSS